MKLQQNSIVSYYTPSLDLMIGVVSEIGDFNEANYGKREPAARVYFGGTKFIVISEDLLKVINNNFVDEQNYMVAYVRFSEQYNQQVDDVNKQLVKIASNIKPKVISKTFLFNSNYTPSGITIIVEKRSDNKKVMKFNGSNLELSDIIGIASIVELSIGGLRVAKDTIKIGDVIGNTSVLHDVLIYYNSL